VWDRIERDRSGGAGKVHMVKGLIGLNCIIDFSNSNHLCGEKICKGDSKWMGKSVIKIQMSGK
jgi:hypothetical protein